MKIVHLAKYYPPEWGGMERVTHDLVTGMADAGIASDVIAFTRTPARAGTSHDGAARVTRCRLQGNPANQPLSLGWLCAAVKAGSDSDGVIVHAPNLLALPVMMVLALLRVIGRGPRDIILLWHSDIVDKGPLGAVMRPFELAMAALATRIVATSPPYAEASPVLRRFQHKVAIVPLGIDPAPPPPASPALDPDLAQWIAGRPLVLSVGRLVPYKGFDILIEAMAQIAAGRACCCLIVGSGPLADPLQADIARLGLSGHVRIVGPLAAEQLDALYRSAAVYCMASRMRSEAFGVVLLEAMSHGLPIAATDIAGSGVPWVAGGPEVAVVVPPENSPALARALAGLLDDPARARQMGSAALARFQRQFTRAAMVAGTIQLLTGKEQDR